MKNYLSASEGALELIKKFEGFQPRLYTCPAGLKTIGYGHVLKIHETKQQITEDEAHQLLLEDVLFAEHTIYRYVKVNLLQNQFDALVSFIFNVGAAAFQRSTLRQKINREEHEDAAREFFRWVYAAGQKLPGLVIRRQLESRLYALEY